MATKEESLSELLDQLNTRTIEDPRISDWSWKADPIDPFTTYSISSGGTSHPSYGAMPNVSINGMSATGINVSSPVWTTNTTAGQYSFTGQNIQPNNTVHITNDTVHIKGENADLLINDKSMKTWMEKVEERLNILTPNPELEKEWDELCRLGERYRKLEKKCKEKADMWNTDVETAQTARCCNCAAFDQSDKILNCIVEGINEKQMADPWDVQERANLGYCQLFKFKCAAARTCDAWLHGGPISDHAEVQ